MENITYKEKYYSIDFLKCFFTVTVIVGHIYRIFFRIEGEFIISFQNMSVDAFYMISGFFIALSVEKLCEFNEDDRWLVFVKNKIKRLYPLYVLTCIIAVIIQIYRTGVFPFYALKYWTTFFFLGGVSTFDTFEGHIWYVSYLFWIGIIYAALLIYCRNYFTKIILPIIILVSFSKMYSIGHLSLNSAIMEGSSYISNGTLKAMCALGIGIELKYISEYIKGVNINKITVVSLEIVAIMFVGYCFYINGNRIENYYIYPGIIIILVIIGAQKSILLSLFNRRVFHLAAKYTYCIYLSHVYYLRLLKEFYQFDNSIRTYFILTSTSIILGLFIHILYEKLILLISPKVKE